MALFMNANIHKDICDNIVEIKNTMAYNPEPESVITCIKLNLDTIHNFDKNFFWHFIMGYSQSNF
jgi:hypothetical protein